MARRERHETQDEREGCGPWMNWLGGTALHEQSREEVMNCGGRKQMEEDGRVCVVE
jgi:hypothetical protein